MAMVGIGTVTGPSLPPGYVEQPFNCPDGSDFAKSQEVGMCVGSDYDPIYSQATPGGVRSYYDLTGAVTGQDKPKVVKSLIPGIADIYIYGTVGALALLLFMRGRR